MNRKILIAIAWPYVNGDIHVGHLAGYLIPADIVARFHRIIGNDVLMVSGSDAHGTPITIEADKKGKSAQEVVDYYHQRDVELFEFFRLSYSLYTLTTTKNHSQVVQELFLNLLENGYIIKKTEKQYYSSEDNKFLPDRYVEGTCPHCGAKDQRSDQCETCGRMIGQGEIIDPKSKLTGSEVILQDTEHYYLDLSGLQKDVSGFLKDKEELWKGWVFAEASGWIKEGLNPRAITRDLDWGVEIPVDKIGDDMMLDRVNEKRFYVWFDAVIGYLSASKEWSERVAGEKQGDSPVIYRYDESQSTDWKNWWYNNDAFHYYFMGQDNVVFHTIMWPAQLLGYDKEIHLPDNVAANKFMNYEGKKFSKSKNWIIDAREIGEKYTVDAVRFFVAVNLPENKEGNFVWEEFYASINNELVANLGNFINRTLVFLEKRFDGKIEVQESEIDSEVKSQVESVFEETREFINSVKLTRAIDRILEFSAFGNKYFNDTEIWTVIKTDPQKAQKIMGNLVQIISALRILIAPFMPEASENLAELISQNPNIDRVGEDFWKFKPILDFKLSKTVTPLFAKIDLESSGQ